MTDNISERIRSLIEKTRREQRLADENPELYGKEVPCIECGKSIIRPKSYEYPSTVCPECYETVPVNCDCGRCSGKPRSYSCGSSFCLCGGSHLVKRGDNTKW